MKNATKFRKLLKELSRDPRLKRVIAKARRRSKGGTRVENLADMSLLLLAIASPFSRKKKDRALHEQMDVVYILLQVSLLLKENIFFQKFGYVMSAFARSPQINFIGKPRPSSWMITGQSSGAIHKGSGLAPVSCVARSPSRIWRTRRREQPKAVAISRTLRPAARRRLISSCLSTVSFLRSIQLSRS